MRWLAAGAAAVVLAAAAPAAAATAATDEAATGGYAVAAAVRSARVVVVVPALVCAAHESSVRTAGLLGHVQSQHRVLAFGVTLVLACRSGALDTVARIRVGRDASDLPVAPGDRVALSAERTTLEADDLDSGAGIGASFPSGTEVVGGALFGGRAGAASARVRVSFRRPVYNGAALAAAHPQRRVGTLHGAVVARPTALRADPAGFDLVLG